jgi:hypothetical protein
MFNGCAPPFWIALEELAQGAGAQAFLGGMGCLVQVGSQKGSHQELVCEQ